jgi:thiamine-monophosphate kinase
VSGGDDYEILCAIPQDVLQEFLGAAEASGVAASRIGTVVAGASIPRFLNAEGKELALTRASYSHF